MPRRPGSRQGLAQIEKMQGFSFGDPPNEQAAWIDGDTLFFDGQIATRKGPVVDVRSHGAVGDGATDDTAAINAAIAYAKTILGREVRLPQGRYAVTSINLTNAVGITLRGDRATTSTGPSFYGTHIVPLTGANTRAVVDLSGSTYCGIRDMQIGLSTDFASSGTAPTLGVLIAGQSGVETTGIVLENVYVTGRFSAAAIYVYGTSIDRFVNVKAYNYTNGAAAIALTANNYASVASAFVTLNTGYAQTDGFYFSQCEFHDAAFSDGTHSTGYGLRLDSVRNTTFDDCDSVGSNYNVLISDGDLTHPTTQPIFRNTFFHGFGSSTVYGAIATATSSVIPGLELNHCRFDVAQKFIGSVGGDAIFKRFRLIAPVNVTGTPAVVDQTQNVTTTTFEDSWIDMIGLGANFNGSLAATCVLVGAGASVTLTALASNRAVQLTTGGLQLGYHLVSAGPVPTAVVGAGAGTSPPATAVEANSTDAKGVIRWGTGTTAGAGIQVAVTFASAYSVAPTVLVCPLNTATQALGLFAAAIGTTGFSLATTTAPANSQANTVYRFSYVVIG